MKLQLFIQGQTLRAYLPTVMVADTVNYFNADFVFKDDAWHGLTKYAHFQLGEECYDIPLQNDRIPESAGLNLKAGSWSMHIHGDRFEDGELVRRITTNACFFTVQESGCLDGSAFPSVPPDLAAELLARVVELEQNGGSGGTGANGKSAYEIAVEHGFEGSEQEWLESLKGEDGKNGQDGENGSDYVLTESDKQEIAEQAALLLKVPEGGGGLTVMQINALDGLFKIAAYTEDATVAYNAFKLAFGIEEPSEPDVPVDPDEPDVPDEPDDNPIEPVYTLASPLTTDGATMVDTGYALADEDKDWTVVCEISGNSDYGKPIWGLGNRIALWSVSAWIWYGGYAPDVYGDSGKGAVQLFTGHPKNRKVILTHNKGGNIITGYYLNNNAVASVEDSSKVYSNIVGVAETVTLGGSTDTAGDKFFAANRTIHDFKIYERVLTEDEIKAYLGVA